ncbi:MAG: class I SAM-dependent methyltransferase [Acidobacteriota bacterium]|nr:class I SAM-dependent methyltransferase [Acidobacteriota bacterium]
MNDHEHQRQHHHEHDSRGPHDEGPGTTWDRRYEEHGWSAVPDESLVEFVAPLTPGRAIDLGCGTGRNALWLARTGWTVTGVDASRVGLEMAVEQARLEGVALRTEQADLVHYVPAAAAFDLVVVANIHLLPSERDDFFTRAAAAVAPGGHLYIVGHHVDALGVSGPPALDRLFEESFFRDRFAGFTIEVLERREALLDTGETEDVVVVLWARRETKGTK